MKFSKLLILTLMLTFLLACGKKTVDITLPNGTIIKAEIAKTPAEREKGLMYHKSLKADEGMLFVFDEQDFRMFWMKNTFIDLDFLFISDEKTINNISHNISRTFEYTPDEQIPRVLGIGQYVLEVPAGEIRKQNLKIGDKLVFEIE
ncbi:MAG: DUF192 domain-containing protein [Elusimicrobiaceae bacterium]|jgi:uncharacterized protein|nr:DUF192 domain-containing protein [Elusimicrobiaceae bacterium]MBT3954538.1 DUF192 domain-containing protein [Elusimicrobiaceae bacterium]MBT4007758.1 DUF192 domain-containing protein [Elusimicrobiaceae bacterium]MBT4402826.1 DUF192 domain-containing protein [Elusimicrobiaceae bacterium]MBT4439525.1 DUF192 domain-containing protein [Elusimicrobiaceae bacterium]